MRTRWSDRFHQLLDGQLRKAERHHLTGEEASRLNAEGKQTPSGQPFRGGMLASGEAAKVPAEKPLTETPAKSFRNLEDAAGALAAVDQRRFAAEYSRLQQMSDEDVYAIPLSRRTELESAVARIRAGQGYQYDQLLVGMAQGNPVAQEQYAFSLQRSNPTLSLLDPYNVPESFHQEIDRAHQELKNNQVFVTAQKRYGELPFIASTVDPRSSKRPTSLGEFVFVGDFAILYWNPDRLEQRYPLREPFFCMSDVDGLVGTIRHEYGHHLSFQLERQKAQTFRDLSDAHLQSGKADNHLQNAYPIIPTVQIGLRGGISLYSLESPEECFAEAFAMVTHPNYPEIKESFAPPAKAVLDFVEGLIA